MTSSKPKACIALPVGRGLADRIAAACEPIAVAWNASRQDLQAALAEAEGLLISNQQYIGDEILAAAPKLRVVSGMGVGYDRFDVAAATKRGVAVCNTPDVVTEAVINLTLGMILALSRRILQNAAYTRDGGWARRDPGPPLGFDLHGKTLGIVGFGRIGTGVTRRAQAFGLQTVFTDVFQDVPPGAPESRYLPFDDLLQESDIVSLHTDLNPTSHHLIGARELGLMKSTAHLINTSRGPVVDQPALAAALRDGVIAGAALDVLELEPPAPDDPILTAPNVMIFPHAGTSTVETRIAMAELSVDNLIAVLAHDRPRACVNPEVLE